MFKFHFKLELFTNTLSKRRMDQAGYSHLELLAVVAFVRPLAFPALVPSLDAFEVVVVAFLAATLMKKINFKIINFIYISFDVLS